MYGKAWFKIKRGVESSIASIDIRAFHKCLLSQIVNHYFKIILSISHESPQTRHCSSQEDDRQVGPLP